MSAKRSERPMGCDRAIVLITVLICQCSLPAITCECGLLRLEGLMVLTGLTDGKVRKVGSPSGGTNFGRSRDVAAWRGQRDAPVSLPSGYIKGLYVFSVQLYLQFVLGARAKD